LNEKKFSGAVLGRSSVGDAGKLFSFPVFTTTFLEGVLIMEYRLMTIEDYPKVWDLWMSSKNMGFNDKDDSPEGIARYLKRNPTSSFVAIQDDRIVGVILSGHDGRRGFIHHMAVAEDCRRQGIAKTLLSMALSSLKEEGITKVALLVFKYNDVGNPFWESQGFTIREDLNYRNKALVEMTRIDT
jgi:ribosomal protein S18 acetylase RimI-like enzyme